MIFAGAIANENTKNVIFNLMKKLAKLKQAGKIITTYKIIKNESQIEAIKKAAIIKIKDKRF